MATIAKVAVGAGSALYKGNVLRKKKLQEAEAYRDAKNRTMAAATREMEEERRTKEFMHSRAVALAAASGGGVDDPTVVKLLGDINAEGEYRVMSRLWAGQDRAEGLLFRSEVARRESDDARTAGVFNALTAGLDAYYG